MICPKCGAAIPLYMRNCPHCDFDSSSKEAAQMVAKDPLDGIKGWLILVAIRVYLAPLALGVALFSEFAAFGDPSITELAKAYPTYVSLMWLGVALAVINFAGAIFVLYLFVKKRKSLPKWWITFELYTLAITFIVPLFYYLYAVSALNLSVAYTDFFEPGELRMLIKSVLSSCIWIPYMLVSKRVKATFTR